MSDDDIPDPLAALDQGLASLTLRARILRHYFEALTTQGFNDEQAMDLTRDYQGEMSA